jgi:hypothetical protein
MERWVEARKKPFRRIDRIAGEIIAVPAFGRPQPAAPSENRALSATALSRR